MMDTNMECDSQFINGDMWNSITHTSDEHMENNITRVLTMCDSMQYNNNTKVRALLRDVNTIMKAEMLMIFPGDVRTTINRICSIYYCNTLKIEVGTTSEETTTDAMMRQLDDFITKLRTTVPDREWMEDESRGYLRSELRTSRINCHKYHDRYDCPPRCPERRRFHRDVSRHQPSVPDRGVSNIYTLSPLSTIFGVQFCAKMHGRIQRVNRRHSRDDGLRRYRANPVMFGDRRGVTMGVITEESGM